MNQSQHLTLFWVILLANALTMIITITAAIKRPKVSYKLVGIIAVCAFIAALHQLVTVQFTVTALVFTGVLVLVTFILIMLNWLNLQKKKS